MTPAGGRALTTYVAGGVLCGILMVGCALTGDDEQRSRPPSVTLMPLSNPDEALPPTQTTPITSALPPFGRSLRLGGNHVIDGVGEAAGQGQAAFHQGVQG